MLSNKFLRKYAFDIRFSADNANNIPKLSKSKRDAMIQLLTNAAALDMQGYMKDAYKNSDSIDYQMAIQPDEGLVGNFSYTDNKGKKYNLSAPSSMLALRLLQIHQDIKTIKGIEGKLLKNTMNKSYTGWKKGIDPTAMIYFGDPNKYSEMTSI